MAERSVEELVKKYTPNHYKEWEREQEMLEAIRETLIGKGWRRKRECDERG